MNDLPAGSSPSQHLEPPRAVQALDSDLDARILAAEYAVIERDRRVRDDASLLMDRLRESTRYSARIAAVAAVGSFGLGWLFGRSPSRHKADRKDPVERHMPALAEAPWAGILPLLWPLLPLAVRSRMSPGLASFLTGIGLPLLARHMGRRQAKQRLKQERQSLARSGNGAATLH